MSFWKGLSARVRSVFRPADAEARLDEEFRFHLEAETEHLIRQGVPPAEARRRALLAFGAVESHREVMRDERGARWFDDLRADVLYALRAMARHPGFLLAATLTLGLGIGVNGIVFGYVNSLLFRPVPAQVPEELAALFTRDTVTGTTGGFGYDDFIDFRDRSGAFAGLAAMTTGAPVSLIVPRSAGNAIGDMVWAEIVTEDFFSVLGTHPAIGRFFTAADAPQGGNAFAVLSYLTWQRRFQGDPGVVGRTVRINGREFVVTGVAPPGFKGMRLLGFWPEVWVPVGMQPALQPGAPSLLGGRGGGPLLVVGRLRPGFDLERTQAVATGFARQLAAAYPRSNVNVGVSVLPAKVGFENPSIIRPQILVLSSALGIVGSLIVLLIICANLAVLQLARTASRAREIAIRLSLGCSRGRLARQLLIESLLIAAPGVVLGAAMMYLAFPLEPYLIPKLAFQAGFAPTADVRVMASTAAIAVAAAMLFGIIPAVRAGRFGLGPSANALGAGRSEVPRRSRTRSVLVASQLALSVMLLIAASLFVRSLSMADAVNLGFEPRDRVIISMNVGLQGYDQTQGLQFYEEILRRTRLLPGVVNASFAFPVPFDTYDRGVRLYVEGLTNSSDGTIVAQATFVADDFVPALGVRLQAGRDFAPGDTAGAPLVMVASESLAARLWPGRSPIGQRARYGSASGPEVTVVGVIADAKFALVGETTARRAYLPLRQRYRDWETLVVHTRDAPAAALSSLREVISGIDPSLPPFAAMTMEQAVANGFAPSRIAVAIAGFFGLLALLIASVGLYAVVARSVVERTRELGVRIAMGMTPQGVLAHLMRDGARLGLIGVAFGLAGGLALARGMVGVLQGLSPADPLTFTLVPAVLIVVVIVATFLPARRAARLDAVAALRSD